MVSNYNTVSTETIYVPWLVCNFAPGYFPPAENAPNEYMSRRERELRTLMRRHGMKLGTALRRIEANHKAQSDAKSRARSCPTKGAPPKGARLPTYQSAVAVRMIAR